MKEKELMLTSILDCRCVDLYLDDNELTPEQAHQLQDMQRRRMNGEPLQYVLGHCDFMGTKLCVDRRVLIPRPETEILVDLVIREFSLCQKKPIKILDLGTGSGNIAIVLAKNVMDCHVTTVDVSADALEVAQLNAKMNGVEKKIEFIHQDMISFLAKSQESLNAGYNLFDLIISNPPYIQTVDLHQLPLDVQQEPRLALDGGEDGLDFYRAIIAYGPHHLNKGGVLMMEMGDEQKDDLEEIIRQYAYYQEINFYKDYVGVDRIVRTSVQG